MSSGFAGVGKGRCPVVSCANLSRRPIVGAAGGSFKKLQRHTHMRPKEILASLPVTAFLAAW